MSDDINTIEQLKIALNNNDIKALTQVLIDNGIVKKDGESKQELAKKLINSKKRLVKDELLGTNILHDLIIIAEINRISERDSNIIYELIKHMITDNPDLLEDKDKTGMNAISKAVEVEELTITKILLSCGANPNSCLWDLKENSLLQEAIDQNNLPLITLLLEHDDIQISKDLLSKLQRMVEKSLDKDNLPLMDHLPLIAKLLEYRDLPISKNMYLALQRLIEKTVNTNDATILEQVGKENVLSRFDNLFLNNLVNVTPDSNNNQAVKVIQTFINQHLKKGQELLQKVSSQLEGRNFSLNPFGESELEKLLIEGVWLNVRDQNCDTALMKAVRENNANVAKLLLQNRANPDITNKVNDTALNWAAHNGNVELCKALIDHGANIDFRCANTGNTPLIVAVKTGAYRVVEYLLTKKPNLATQDNSGNTALMTACQNNNIDCIKLFIQNGANPETQINGEPLICWAAINDHTDIAKELLIKGANPNIPASNNDTALNWAAHNGNVELCKALIDHGANIDFRCANTGNTPLIVAVKRGACGVVEYLLTKKPNLGIVDNFGNTALMTALHSHNIYCIKLLIENGIDPNTQVNGDPLLCWALKQGYTDIAEVLVANGADVHARDNDNNTALSLALKHSNTRMVAKLLMHGAIDYHLPSIYTWIAPVSPELAALEKVKSNIEKKFAENATKALQKAEENPDNFSLSQEFAKLLPKKDLQKVEELFKEKAKTLACYGPSWKNYLKSYILFTDPKELDRKDFITGLKRKPEVQEELKTKYQDKVKKYRESGSLNK